MMYSFHDGLKRTKTSLSILHNAKRIVNLATIVKNKKGNPKVAF